MRRIGAVAMVCALSVLAACGGGGGDGGLPEAGEDVARIQPGNRPVRFRLDTAVPDDVQRFIVETLGWVHSDLGDSGPLTIHVYSDEERFATSYNSEYGIPLAEARQRMGAGLMAFASPGGHIWIYLPNFLGRPELTRRVALFHEYTHTLQNWQAEVQFQSAAPDERSFVPRWIVEGCAEYLAVKDTGRRRLVDDVKQRQTVVDRAKTSNTSLEALETGGEASFRGGTGEAYTVGWLGCERLAALKGEDAVTHDFWLALAKQREWHAAFTQAFGVEPTAFYADFATFRATL